MTVNAKALGAAAVLLVVVAAVVGTATAAFRGGSVTTYTGCRDSKLGVVYFVAPGTKPMKSCKKGDDSLALSAGDVTRVTAGTGLSGGGESGDVAVGLDPKYALPQSCANGQVAKANGSGWVCATDQGSAYTAGGGLELSGNELRLKTCGNGQTMSYTQPGVDITQPGGWDCGQYALAAQSCPPGQFASSIRSNGLLSCLAPAGGGGTSAYFGEEVNPTQGGVRNDDVGIPSDGVERPYAFAVVPPGTYLVTATAEIGSEHNVDFATFNPVSCRLNDAADERTWERLALNDDSFEGSFSLQGSISSPGGALSLICRAVDDAPGISIHQARISALKVG
jgi:hypothetical protein